MRLLAIQLILVVASLLASGQLVAKTPLPANLEIFGFSLGSGPHRCRAAPFGGSRVPYDNLPKSSKFQIAQENDQFRCGSYAIPYGIPTNVNWDNKTHRDAADKALGWPPGYSLSSDNLELHDIPGWGDCPIWLEFWFDEAWMVRAIAFDWTHCINQVEAPDALALMKQKFGPPHHFAEDGYPFPSAISVAHTGHAGTSPQEWLEEPLYNWTGAGQAILVSDYHHERWTPQGEKRTKAAKAAQSILLFDINFVQTQKELYQAWEEKYLRAVTAGQDKKAQDSF